MRKKFYGYYTPTKKEFDALWQNCTFVFDTNTLLNLYRYTEATYGSFLEILESLSDRIWIPFKVADEFHRNRINCISDQQKAYDYFIKAYDKVVCDFNSTLNKYKQHKVLDIEEHKKDLEAFTSKAKKKIEKTKKKHPDYIKNDSILNNISCILQKKIGTEYTENYLQKIYDDGESRFSKKIPPGYMDRDKSDNYRLYGDLIIWKDIINKATTDKKSIIFVTSDNKEDWWLEYNGKRLGPRPELIQEFKKETGQEIFIYNPAPFIKYASTHLQLKTDKRILDEIESVRKNQFHELKETTLRSAWNDMNIQQFNNRLSYIESQSQAEPNVLRELYRKEHLYSEEKATLTNKMNELQRQIKSIEILIESGISDEDQEQLEIRRNKRASRLVGYQYSIHELNEKLMLTREKISKFQREYNLLMANNSEEIPF